MLRRKITYKPLAFLIAVLFLPTVLPAQSTRVRGRVTDAADGTPMQFVSVVFPGTTTGITTDEAGIYTLETRDTVSRVQASMVGYASQTKPLVQGGFNQIDFALEAVEFGIGSVVITPGDNRRIRSCGASSAASPRTIPTCTTATPAPPIPRCSST